MTKDKKKTKSQAEEHARTGRWPELTKDEVKEWKDKLQKEYGRTMSEAVYHNPNSGETEEV